ncbi:ATP-binding cassette domain-containing protein [Aestuariirhabdus sp. Z084]|uniref:metal ABC transporter ATP-binding protein n=1 Tax=Aestuariirhabdus haliotis TaxID=2918751 RepID=UPI0020C028A8|nr:ATP-binding cassette domain-containing protein [Aestuariirhabdus haliotis]MCL6417564.1 ATP-binding cassette domain-containing protein [Aestuariirhabdus haliotis]
MIADLLYGPSIVFSGVSLKQGQNILLKDISCEFNAGQWHGVVGPNGGGKSSLLKTMLGLKPHTGSIRIHWPSLASESASAIGAGIKGKFTKSSRKRSRIGYVPQLMPFDVSLPVSVRDYVLMSLSHKPLFFSRRLPPLVIQALDQVGLHNKLERKLGDLSGGERQRLMLCCALLHQPYLLILDEPMTGLDRQGQDEVVAILMQYRESGGTIVMVEHDWQLVDTHCDQVFLIDKGLKQTGHQGCLAEYSTASGETGKVADGSLSSPVLVQN